MLRAQHGFPTAITFAHPEYPEHGFECWIVSLKGHALYNKPAPAVTGPLEFVFQTHNVPTPDLPGRPPRSKTAAAPPRPPPAAAGAPRSAIADTRTIAPVVPNGTHGGGGRVRFVDHNSINVPAPAPPGTSSRHTGWSADEYSDLSSDDGRYTAGYDDEESKVRRPTADVGWRCPRCDAPVSAAQFCLSCDERCFTPDAATQPVRATRTAASSSPRPPPAHAHPRAAHAEAVNQGGGRPRRGDFAARPVAALRDESTELSRPSGRSRAFIFCLRSFLSANFGRPSARTWRRRRREPCLPARPALSLPHLYRLHPTPPSVRSRAGAAHRMPRRRAHRMRGHAGHVRRVHVVPATRGLSIARAPRRESS